VFIGQFALLILALLLSVRSVWDFINDFLDGITGLNERSFGTREIPFNSDFFLSLSAFIK
jgi:hypothetical protein